MTSHRAILAAVLLTTGSALAAGKAVVMPKGDIKWEAAGFPGVTRAVVDGDIAKGASHFYLKYASGLVTPLHHHSPDHYVTTVSGNLVLAAGGKETKLPPGSFFALTGKEPHVAKCEGAEDCVMFIDARGPWDVVPEKESAGK